MMQTFIASDCTRRRVGHAIGTIGACLLSAGIAAADCTTTTLNKNCVVTIERENAVSPATIQMRSSAAVTITVTKRPLETIQFDVSLAQTAPPDPLAAIFGAILTPLESLGIAAPVHVAGAPGTPPPPPPLAHSAAFNSLDGELESINIEQTTIQTVLTTIDASFRATGDKLAALQALPGGSWTTLTANNDRREFQCDVRTATEMSGGSVCGAAAHGLGTSTLPIGAIKVVDARLDAALPAFRALPSAEQAALAEKFNRVNTNQARLRANLKSSRAAQVALVNAADLLDPVNFTQTSATRLVVRPDTFSSGTATVKITAHDVVSQKDTPLATVVISWGGTRWEVSAGAVFSKVPGRSFDNAIIFENGAPKSDAGGFLTRVTETQTKPAVVPAAFVHYRIADGQPAEGQRIALLATFMIGVNLYSKSADFGLGPTFSYRGLMITPLWQLTRDLRLTNGIKPGAELGSSPPALPTERFWANTFGVGVSYRVGF